MQPETMHGLCPVCNERLQKKQVEFRAVVVPDGHAEAEWTGRGEVMRRSRVYAATVNGVREVVQDLKVWQGEFESQWAPFCTAQCGARFGINAWVSGFTGDALAATPPQQGVAADRKTLAQDFSRLVEHVTDPQPDSPQLFGADQPSRLKPGDEGWHPPGLPPPVPGVFKYGRDGRRVDMRPEAATERYNRITAAREAREGMSRTEASNLAQADRRAMGGHIELPPLTPEILEAMEDDAPSGLRSPTKITKARALRFKQLWPDIRFPLTTVCAELNKLPGPPIAGANSMTNVAIQLGMPTRRMEVYGFRKSVGKIQPSQ